MNSNVKTPVASYPPWVGDNKDMWKDKVAFITGAGSTANIGGVTARAFASLGVQVAVMDLNDKNFQSLETAIVDAGGKKPLCLTGDVSKAEDCQKAIDEIEKAFGRLDFAFNNAGIGPAGAPINEIAPEHFDKVLKIDLSGIYYCLRAELNLMEKLGNGGAIVNTASVLGLRSGHMSTDYSAAKFGVIGLTKGSAIDMAKKNIRVNAICPGAVETPLLLDSLKTHPEIAKKLADEIPMAHSVSVNEIAQAVLFLCHPNMTSLTGVALPVDGGMTALIG